MLTRAEKLFNIRAQIAKAKASVEHGDTFTSDLAQCDALDALVTLIEEEMPEKVLPALHAEPTKIKVKK
jgi:hypothetical protein